MYRIDRIIPGGFRDSLMVLWEGSDLPAFARHSPYLFDDKATAERVAQRLAAKCSETMATPHLPSRPITYEVMEVSQHAWGRYAVYSYDKWQSQFPNATPARYDRLDDAKRHAESVTYRMVVVDSKAESIGFVYCNWEPAALKIAEITRVPTYGSCQLIARFDDESVKHLFHYYLDELSFTDAELIGLTEAEAHALRHQRDVAYLRS